MEHTTCDHWLLCEGRVTDHHNNQIPKEKDIYRSLPTPHPLPAKIIKCPYFPPISTIIVLHQTK